VTHSLTRASAGALAILAGVVALALAAPRAADAATCYNRGVTHIGSGNSSIDVISCRAAAPGGYQREYGQIFIGSTSTRAPGCAVYFFTEERTDEGNIERLGPEKSHSCSHILRRNRTVTFYGGSYAPVPSYADAQRTLVMLFLRHGNAWRPAIEARSRWMPIR
jgi:hypothetical protein